MMHAWEAGQCVLCGATESEVNQNIATPDCLGPAGYRLRKEAILEAIEKAKTTTAEPSSVGVDAVGASLYAKASSDLSEASLRNAMVAIRSQRKIFFDRLRLSPIQYENLLTKNGDIYLPSSRGFEKI